MTRKCTYKQYSEGLRVVLAGLPPDARAEVHAASAERSAEGVQRCARALLRSRLVDRRFESRKPARMSVKYSLVPLRSHILVLLVISLLSSSDVIRLE